MSSCPNSQSVSPVNNSHTLLGKCCAERVADEVEASGANLNAVDDQPDVEVADEEAMDVAHGDDEARRPRIARRPLAPTKEMVEEHNGTHAEYRDWCPHCRAGKSTGLHHQQGDPDEGKLGVTVSVDFAFRLKEEQEDDLIPVLVAYDNSKKRIWTLEVEEKGISDTAVAVEWLVSKLDASGYHGGDFLEER